MPATTLVRHRWSDLPFESINPSIDRKFITTDRITLAHFELKRGGVVPRHAHENEQISWIVKGALKFKVDGDEMVVSAGEVLQIPGGVAHEVEVLEDTFVVDVFSPKRQDWVDKTDSYFQR
jgi:unsaturated pyranuronate lyase